MIRPLLRLSCGLVIAFAFIGGAAAQGPSQPAAPRSAPPASSPASSPSTYRHQTLRERFEAANTTHDGRLTPEQAQAGMPFVARHFAEIDRDKKGYVTLDDVREWLRSRPHRTLRARFEAANTAHDGHLTRAEAEHGLPFVAEHFDEIDTSRKGYVTYDEVLSWIRARRHARDDAPNPPTQAH